MTLGWVGISARSHPIANPIGFGCRKTICLAHRGIWNSSKYDRFKSDSMFCTLSPIGLKSDSEKLVTKNLDGKGEKDLFYSHSDWIENIHSKPVLSFYIAHGDMFRAQGDLLTPSELRDTLHQSRQVLFKQWNPFVWYSGAPLDFREIWPTWNLWRHLSRSSDGVRRCPWALNTSPWAK